MEIVRFPDSVEIDRRLRRTLTEETAMTSLPFLLQLAGEERKAEEFANAIWLAVLLAIPAKKMGRAFLHPTVIVTWTDLRHKLGCVLVNALVD
ncbi:MAG: hypothetical protein Q7S52_02230, partial [bacterium]|nr:hypothetical protein [bacterium]